MLGIFSQQINRNRFFRHHNTGNSNKTQKNGQSELINRLIKTQLEGKDILPQAIYFLTFAAIGFPLCIKMLLTRPLPDTKTTVLLAILGLIAYHLPVTLPSNIQIHPGFPLLMGALYCYGVSAAIVVLMPSMLLYFFTTKHALFNCLFNVGQFTLCLYLAEMVGLWAGWIQGAPATNADLLIICLMILTYDLLNILFVTGSICIDTKQSFGKCFVRAFYLERKAMLPQRTFLTIVAMLLSSHMGNISFVIVFIGVISLRFQNLFQRELVIKTEEAETDPLTKTYNMRYLHRWLEDQIQTLSKDEDHCSFIFADVDGLKSVNDRYGHNIGNELLIHVSQILIANVRSKDQVARYGGDEFIVACPNTKLNQAISIALRILQDSNNKPFVSNGAKIDFGISMGIASWPEHGETVFDIIRMADKAMYLAKRSGGNTLRSAANL